MSLCFFFTFIDSDYLLANHLVSQIKEFYPASQILAISDGGSKDNGLDCKCQYRENLKKPGTIGLFTQRNFEFILENINSSINYIIKLDPDSYLRHNTVSIPDKAWMGRIKSGSFSFGESTWAMGGAYCIKKITIQDIVESRLLLDKRIKELEDFETRQNRVYEDFRLGWVANQLNIYPSNWPCVSVNEVNYKSKLARRFSILHPAKDKL